MAKIIIMNRWPWRVQNSWALTRLQRLNRNECHSQHSFGPYTRGVGLELGTGTAAILTKAFREFPQFLKTNSGIVFRLLYYCFLLHPCQYIYDPTIKIKLSLCLTKHFTMKTYGWSGCIDPRILDLGTRRSFLFTRWERSPVPIGYEVRWTPEPLWTIRRSVIYWHLRDSNPELFVIHPVASLYSYSYSGYKY
jgi:hypothetical protein